MPKVELWDSAKFDISILRDMHLALADLSAIGPYLIYQNHNFREYILRKLTDENHTITVLARNGEALGFCHVISEQSSLFLNNIYVSPDSHGSGNGSTLLRATLLRAQSKADHSSSLALDVFNSNTRACHWYQKLGLKEQSRSHWIFKGHPLFDRTDSGVEFINDQNGFEQLYFEDEHLGTFLGGYVITGTERIFALAGRDHVRGIILRQLAGPQGANLVNDHVLETSIRMAGGLRTVISRLSPES